MKTKIFVWVFAFFVAISFAHSWESGSTFVCYEFDNSTNVDADVEVDVTGANPVQYNATTPANAPSFNQTGIVNSSIFCDGTGSSREWLNTTTTLPQGDWHIRFGMRAVEQDTTADQYTAYIVGVDNGTQTMYLGIKDSNGAIFGLMQNVSGTYDSFECGSGYEDGIFRHVDLSYYDNGTFQVVIDNSTKCSVVVKNFGLTHTHLPICTRMRVGGVSTDNDDFFTGNVDTFLVGNATFSDAERSDDYNSGSMRGCPSPPAPPVPIVPPNITSVVINSSFGTNRSDENLTVFAEYVDNQSFDVSLTLDWYRDGVLNSTQGNLSEPGLLAFYFFDYDFLDYKLSYDLTGGGNPTIVSDCIFESCVSVGDNDSLEADGLLDSPKNFSVEFWVKLDESTFDGHRYFFVKENSAVDELEFYIWDCCPIGDLSSRLHLGTDINNSYSYMRGNFRDWNAGEWYHIVYVHDSVRGDEFWINGSLDANDTGRTLTIGDGSLGNFFVGSNRGEEGLRGDLDNFKVYNRSLSQTEIEVLHNSRRKNTVSEADTVKGEEWVAGVRASNYFAYSNVTFSSALTVLNVPPTITNLTINSSSELFLETDNLDVLVETFDYDNDTVILLYDWYVDGTLNSTMGNHEEFNIYFPMGEETPNKDYAYITDCTNINTLEVDGVYGRAYDFQGTGALICGYEPETNLLTEYTLESWVWVDTKVTSDILRKQYSYGMKLLKAGVILNPICSVTTDAEYTVQSTTNLNVDRWYQLVCTYDGSQLRLYIDGVLNTNTSVSGAINQSTNAFTVSYPNAFNGYVDEVKVMNRSVSANDVRMRYDSIYRINHISNTETSYGENWAVRVCPLDYENVGVCKLEESVIFSEVLMNLTFRNESGFEKYSFLEGEPFRAYANLTRTPSGDAVNDSICNATFYVGDNESFALSFNSTLSLYVMEEPTSYSIFHESIEVVADCSPTDDSFAGSDTKQVEIIDAPHEVFHDNVSVNVSTYYFVNGSAVVSFDVYDFFFEVTIVDNHDFWGSHIISCSNGSVINRYDYYYDYSDSQDDGDFNLSYLNFVDFDCNPYVLFSNSTDVVNNSVNTTSYFNVTDENLPVAVGIDDFEYFVDIDADTGIHIPTPVSYSVEFFDENFFSYNCSCDNGFEQSETGLNTNYYMVNINFSINQTTTCDWRYCDGHTKNLLTKNWGVVKTKDDSNNSMFKFRMDNKDEQRLTVKNDDITLSYEEKEDRITFSLNNKNAKGSMVDYVLVYETTADAVYMEDDDFVAWFVSPSFETWFDLNGVEDVAVFKLSEAEWELRFSSNETVIKFESIGELNCVNDTQTITANFRTLRHFEGVLTPLECKDDTVQDVLVMIFLFAFIIVVFLMNVYYLKFPFVDILCGIAMIFYSLMLHGCHQMIGYLGFIFAIALILYGGMTAKKTK